MDPGARPGPRHPLEGELLVVARAEAAAPGPGGEAGERAAEDARPRAGVGPDGPARPGCQEPGPIGPLRATGQPGPREARRVGPAPDPAGTAPGRPRRPGRGPPQGVWRPPPV